MSMELTPAARTARPASRLATGTRLGGGRYTLGNQLRSGLLADLYEATDSTTGNAVSIHVLDPRLVQGREVVAQVNADVQRAQSLSHKNIAQVIELAVEGPHTYVVTELVEGHSLRELIDRKRETGTVGFGAKGSLNIVTHVAAALAAAADAPHGGLTLDSIAVSRAGRVRVSDFGLAAIVPGAVKAGQQSPGLAPEVIAGQRPTAASDVYGLGAVLYEILVGAPPIKGCKRPSEAVPGVPPAVDAVIGRSMNAAPEKRFPDVEALRAAITAALSEAGRPSAQMAAQSPGASASLAESLAAGASGQMGATGATPSTSGAAPAPAAAAAAAAAASLAQPTPALMAAMQSTDERWLISKGKLDFGPYTLAVICEQIQTNVILPGHVIIDKDTGGRKKVEDHPLLFELVEAAKSKRDEARRTQAEVQHATSEKRRGAALYLFIGIGVLALGGGVYFLVTKLAADKKDENSGAIVALEGGSLQAKISFPSKAERERRAKGRRKGGGGKAGAGGPAGSWDDSLNLDMSDDESEDGGSDRLSDSDVNPVIQRHGSGLARCLTSTGTHNANIEFHVKPDGRVSQSRVNGQTGTPVASCIRGVMQKMQFPTFNGVRSKHEFDIAY